MESREAPVDTIEPQVFCQPVFELVFTLLAHEHRGNFHYLWQSVQAYLVETLNVLDMLLHM